MKALLFLLILFGVGFGVYLALQPSAAPVAETVPAPVAPPPTAPAPAPVPVPTAPAPEVATATPPVPIIVPVAPVKPVPIPAQDHWDWVINGHTYHDVVVLAIHDDCVDITYTGGTGSPALDSLTPDLQKLFNYSPERAAAAAQQKEKDREAVVAALPRAVPTPVVPMVQNAAPPNSSHPVPGSAENLHKTAADIAAIQAKIDELKDDITEKQREINHNRLDEYYQETTSQNAYRRIIEDDQKQIVALQKSLDE